MFTTMQPEPKVRSVRPAATSTRPPTPVTEPRRGAHKGRERAVVSAWVDDQERRELDAIAAQIAGGVTRSAVVRQAVEEFLVRHRGLIDLTDRVAG